jgi:hypothetical protein
MPLFYVRTHHGNDCGASSHGFECLDKNAAWTEMTKICGDLVGSVTRDLGEGDEWQMELLDESSKPLYRIRLVAKTLLSPGS